MTWTERRRSQSGIGGVPMPNRIIKESICTSDTIDQMSWFVECFYVRLWTACDDYGRMDARPAILKSRLFPLKDRLSLKDIENALYKLADIGCVRLYECDSKPYLYLPAWEVHQQIRAKKSKYPPPDETCNKMISDDIKCPRNPIQSESESILPTSRSKAGSGRKKDAPEGFDQFWSAYPRKDGKKKACEAFLKAATPLETLLTALERHKRLPQWNREGGQYIPYAATWLNQRRWEDEITTGGDAGGDPFKQYF